MALIYLGIWRDFINWASDSESILENFSARGYQPHLSIKIKKEDFRRIKSGEEQITVGISPVILPRFIFEKDLSEFIPTVKKSKRNRGYWGKLLFGEGSQEDPDQKFSKRDSTILLASDYPIHLLALLRELGFVYENDEALNEIRSMLLPEYFAIAKGKVIQEYEAEDIKQKLSDLSINLSLPFTIKSHKLMEIPLEKAEVLINEEEVLLPAFIYQVKISFDSPLDHSITKNREEWIVLGAEEETVLEELLLTCGFNNDLPEYEENEPEKKYIRQPIPEDVQIFVWQRDEGRCVKCGSQENLEYDHIIPLSKGGSNTARNIQLLCEKCNRQKGNRIG